ncbi:hypothetical protein TNCV_997411 [Trichonephila clavipes]|nr:hypothetical protein TNCV_997411 [Trichonephila clavipes]
MEVKAKKGILVKLKPKAVVFYNNSMGGADRSDQYLSYYPVVAWKSTAKILQEDFSTFLLTQNCGIPSVIFKKSDFKSDWFLNETDRMIDRRRR